MEQLQQNQNSLGYPILVGETKVMSGYHAEMVNQANQWFKKIKKEKKPEEFEEWEKDKKNERLPSCDRGSHKERSIGNDERKNGHRKHWTDLFKKNKGEK